MRICTQHNPNGIACFPVACFFGCVRCGCVGALPSSYRPNTCMRRWSAVAPGVYYIARSGSLLTQQLCQGLGTVGDDPRRGAKSRLEHVRVLGMRWRKFGGGVSPLIPEMNCLNRLLQYIHM